MTQTNKNCFSKKKKKGSRDCTIAQPVHVAMNMSARSGADPSVPSKASAGEATKEHANALLREMAIIRDHLRRQARNADRLNTREASRAGAPASASMKPIAPTKWLLAPSRSSRYLAAFTCRAAVSTALLTWAALGHAAPWAVTADRKVMSTVSCVP